MIWGRGECSANTFVICHAGFIPASAIPIKLKHVTFAMALVMPRTHFLFCKIFRFLLTVVDKINRPMNEPLFLKIAKSILRLIPICGYCFFGLKCLYCRRIIQQLRRNYGKWSLVMKEIFKKFLWNSCRACLHCGGGPYFCPFRLCIVGSLLSVHLCAMMERLLDLR